MRFIIYGAGAVGGTIGSRLFQHGHDVLLIARGEHFNVIRDKGLTFVTPVETITQAIPVVAHPGDIDFQTGDVVLLTMKTQHCWQALLDLREVAGDEIPVICCQNGVENERIAARIFQNVYGMVVMLPANHFEPGTVECNSVNKSGILDAGIYPQGVDGLIEEVTAVLDKSQMSAVADAQIMRWKYKKLLMNLNNSLQAICTIDESTRDIVNQVREEALAVYQAANIRCASDDDDKNRRADLIQMKPINGQRRSGGSSWQSLKNGKGDIESDYLNGEIVLLGQLNGVPTPANAALQFLAASAARSGLEPGSLPVEIIEAKIKSLS